MKMNPDNVFMICLFLAWVLCAGEPDLMDALVSRLTACK